MTGTNPNGTKYSDPDIPWVSYFNGGDASARLHPLLLRLPPESRVRRDALRVSKDRLSLHADRHPRHRARLTSRLRPEGVSTTLHRRINAPLAELARRAD